jgi:hypothetical protein
VARHQQTHHVERLGYPFGLLDRGEFGEFPVSRRRGITQRADAFGDEVERCPQLGVFVHEHEVQRVEHGAFHVPVEVVGLEIQRVGVGEYTRQALHDLLAILALDADVDERGGLIGNHAAGVLLCHVVTPHSRNRGGESSQRGQARAIRNSLSG